MAIIAHKNDLQNFDNFIESTITNDYINGLIVPIVPTKDGNLIIYDNSRSTFTAQVIQQSTLTSLKSTSLLKLDDFLNKLRHYQKRIIINIYPLALVTLSDETIQYFNEQNNHYVDAIKNVIDKYPNLDISLVTVNNHLLQIIKRKINDRKKGLIILQENLNYTDIDFYIISPQMLDVIILKEQLNRGKELMIYSITASDMALINDFFKDNSTPLKQELFYKLTFISAYPEMFYELLYIK